MYHILSPVSQCSVHCRGWMMNEWPILLFILRLFIQSSLNFLHPCSPDRDPMTVVAAIPLCCHHAPRPWPRPSKQVRGIQKKSRCWWCKRCQWEALSVSADLRHSSVASRFRTQVGDRWEHCRYPILDRNTSLCCEAKVALVRPCPPNTADTVQVISSELHICFPIWYRHVQNVMVVVEKWHCNTFSISIIA